MPPRKKSAAAKPTKTRPQTASSSVKSTASARAPRASLAHSAKPTKKAAQSSLELQVNAVLTSLKQLADKRVLADMSGRYGVYTSKAFGVSMSKIQRVAKPLLRNHELAAALWETGWYEARMATSFIEVFSCSRAASSSRSLDRGDALTNAHQGDLSSSLTSVIKRRTNPTSSSVQRARRSCPNK
jgi:hypothetical protein